jgi:hypothetical protein
MRSIPGAQQAKWDGAYQRGYGRTRCIPLPKSCGQPGEACCASMMDQRISGLVHNRLFPYQPCNYRAGGKAGIYCRGQWQGGLLQDDAVLGTCTLNTDDCGQARATRRRRGRAFPSASLSLASAAAPAPPPAGRGGRPRGAPGGACRRALRRPSPTLKTL